MKAFIAGVVAGFVAYHYLSRPIPTTTSVFERRYTPTPDPRVLDIVRQLEEGLRRERSA